MGRLPLLALAALLALACGTPPCQELGERLCSCSGLGKDACKRQVEDQLKSVHPSDSTCDAYLASCHEPAGAVFCEWITTEAGMQACGIALPAAP